MKTSDDTSQVRRRQLLLALMAGGATIPLVTASGSQEECNSTGDDHNNALLWAVAWKQTAAEYRALCHQAYNLARLRLDLALESHKQGDKPLAVITDMDDTILHANSYWGHLINEGKSFFDDAIWDEWLPHNLVTTVPGSLGFFNYCYAMGVEVFYVTSRNQGKRTYEYALTQLIEFEFPYADEMHLTVFQNTSDKSPARELIAKTHKVALLLGDNLNDYKRDYYVKGIDERAKLMEKDRAEFGDIFILLPNPTDGHWVRAIFGESEPKPTNTNYEALLAAATRDSWDGN